MLALIDNKGAGRCSGRYPFDPKLGVPAVLCIIILVNGVFNFLPPLVYTRLSSSSFSDGQPSC
ncbi:hypothetical protein BDW72DRAFT_174085 [Aspergillus terricola var. indicus]